MSTPVTQTTPADGGGPPSRESDFTAKRHVYEPHRVGLPPLGPYFRELWRRREFAVELSRTNLREQHFNTVFGQLWLILNPLLLCAVYFVLVDILRAGHRPPGFLAHLVGAVFAYYFVSDIVRRSIRSVTSGGRLILNTSFPRTLLPLSAVITGIKRFGPTMLIYIPIYLLAGRPIVIQLLWLIPLFCLMTVLSIGLATIVSASQVYFRDLKNFLPYLLRIWLYASPVLYTAQQMPQHYKFLLWLNPLGPLIAGWSNVLDRGIPPTSDQLIAGALWAFGLFVIGLVFFISREREFAVRL
jgi:ABC-type polysaccharide/polyol phosphate export permease